MAIEINNNDLVVQSLSARTNISFPEPSRRNLFSRVLTNDTVMYKGSQVLNNWLIAENGLYYHPLNYYNTDTSQMTSINANFGLSYNFTGQFTYILSATNTLQNDNFDFDLISNIQYVDSNKSFLIGEGLGYRGGSNITTILSSGNQFYIGGFFQYFNNGMAPNSFARINLNGSQDYTLFNLTTGASLAGFTQFGTTGSVRVIKRDINNKILVSGDFRDYNSIPVTPRLVRLNTDLSIDTSLSAVTQANGFNATVVSTEPLSDGKILVGGFFTTYNNQTHRGLVRLNYDGSVDTSLSAVAGSSRFFALFGGSGNVYETLIEPDNKMVIGGYFAQYNSQTHNNFIRLNYDGSVDTSLSAVGGASRFNFPSSIFSIKRGLNNTYMVGGDFFSYNSQTHNRFIRLNYNGSIDTSLSAVAGSSRFNGTVYDIVLQPDGKILVGGAFTTYNNQTHGGLVRLNYDGSVDTSFITGTGFTGQVLKILLLTNGKILVGGNFTSYNNENARGIILLNSDGTSDTSSQNQFLERIKHKINASPGNASINYENFDSLFLPTIQDGQICIGSVQPISFATLDYTLVSNYGSGTIGFGTS